MKKVIFNNFFFLHWNYFNLMYLVLISIIFFNILMFSNFNYISFIKFLFKKYCFYYSRSKNNFWFKGDVSKNFQILKHVFIDCDMDFLVINIFQFYNLTCHTKNDFCNINLIKF